jgi:membrane associated rhomboid family serine protease
MGVMLIQLVTRPDGEPLQMAQIFAGHGSQYGWFTDLFDLRPDQVMQFQVWRLLTYAFLHPTGAFLQFVLGMWFLWRFGPDIEQLYGSPSFLAFYLLGILIPAATYTVVCWVRGIQGASNLWSEEVLAALLIISAIHFPNRIIMILFIIPVPIWMLAALYIGSNLYFAVGGLGTQAVVLSQLAAAAVAFGFYKYKRDHVSLFSDLFANLRRWRAGRRQSSLKLYRPETELPREPVSVAAATQPMDEHFEAKLDAVLEKIARTGKGSLTADEQQILIQASELYRKKRT